MTRASDPLLPELTFAQVREDPALELAVADRLYGERRRGLRVLMVASGGCTALSLLSHQGVARIDAVDTNPAQLHLIALRMEAMARLARHDQLAFLGGRGEVMEGQRARQYGVVRGYLPAEARAHWDERPDAIAYGLNRAGRFEWLCRELAASFAEQRLDPVARPAEALTHKTWPTSFEAVFGKTRLTDVFGEAMLAYTTATPGSLFASAYARAMLKHAPQQNYFLHQTWRDAYPSGDEALPVYMQPAPQASILRGGLHRLKLHEGRLEALMPTLAADGPYDMVVTGNRTDWLPASGTRALLEGAGEVLAAGGAVLARRIWGSQELANELGPRLHLDGGFSAQLLARDRAVVTAEVAVAFKP